MAGSRALHTVGTPCGGPPWRWALLSGPALPPPSWEESRCGVISWFDSDPFTEFTWRGTWVVLKVVFLGTVPLGFAFALLRPLLPGRLLVQGLALGVLLLLYPGVPYLFGHHQVEWLFLMRRPATLSLPHVLSVRGA